MSASNGAMEQQLAIDLRWERIKAIQTRPYPNKPLINEVVRLYHDHKNEQGASGPAIAMAVFLLTQAALGPIALIATAFVAKHDTWLAFIQLWILVEFLFARPVLADLSRA